MACIPEHSTLGWPCIKGNLSFSPPLFSLHPCFSSVLYSSVHSILFSSILLFLAYFLSLHSYVHSLFFSSSISSSSSPSQFLHLFPPHFYLTSPLISSLLLPFLDSDFLSSSSSFIFLSPSSSLLSSSLPSLFPPSVLFPYVFPLSFIYLHRQQSYDSYAL